MKIYTIRYRSIRLELDTGTDMSTLAVYSARGYERGSNFFTRDLQEKIEELRKMYAYFRGEKSHYVRALDLLSQKVSA
jgi:hypothetical protein